MAYFTDPSDVLENTEILFAHRREGKEKETLIEHIQKCEKYFEKIVLEKGFLKIFESIFSNLFHGASPEGEAPSARVREESFQKEMFPLFLKMTWSIVSFHDLGKANPKFQEDKMKNPMVLDKLPGIENSNHSLLSSILFMDYFSKRIFEKKEHLGEKELFLFMNLLIIGAYVISRHHQGLDNLSSYIGKFNDGEVSKIMEEIFASHPKEILCELSFFRRPENVKYIYRIMEKIKGVDPFSKDQKMTLYLYSRLMHSLLVAADYYATSEYMGDIEILDIGNLKDIERIISSYERSPILKSIRDYEKREKPDFSTVKDINILRSEMFLESEKGLKKVEAQSNIFFLEAPTGGGKSNIAMNLSFQLAKKHHLGKIIYVYPFNTLVEQNITTLEKTFSEDPDILEEVAVINSISPIKEFPTEVYDEKYYQKTLLDKQFLNYPFVLTTHVSLFHWMFSCYREHIFCFHQLANTVIVLDEIQSYKNSIWTEIISFLNVFSKILNFKVIIMSATLPDLGDLLDKETEVEIPTLLKNRKQYYNNPLFKNRVVPDFSLLKKGKGNISLEEIKDHLFENFQGEKVLMEFFKKKTAHEFYDLLLSDPPKGVQIELMTGDDNQIERERILKKIKESSGDIVLVATSVVEAGVDIDMDIGYKDISKFDSEEQFSGRINRSCLRSGKVFFFDLDEEGKIYKEDLRVQPEFSIREEKIQEIFQEKNFEQYYDILLAALRKRRNEREGKEGLSYFFEELGMLNFREVENRMRLIDSENQISVLLNMNIKTENGEALNGKDLFYKYKKTLMNKTLSYSEKKVLLSKIKSKMSYFIFTFYKNESPSLFDDQIGDLFLIEDPEEYLDLKTGKLKRNQKKAASYLII